MFAYDFMRNAFAAATIVAIVAGLVGYFLVLRGQSFAGHALSHVGFTGAAAAVLLNTTPLGGMVIATVAAGIGMGALGEKLAQRDVAIGMVLALALGLGLLFLHFFAGSATQATSILFGNVLAVNLPTIRLLALLAVISIAALAMVARPLLFASLQPELAEAKGVSLRLLGILFLAIAALATAECAQIVGVLLVFTLMVGPAATALNLTKTIPAGLSLAVIIALVESWGGLTLAYYTDWPVSFWISALSVIGFLSGRKNLLFLKKKKQKDFTSAARHRV